ncbi:transcription factor IIIA-like [Glycine soja]|uniref:transcription factor IIIA-like n=1 Tax=Glycine soja TaxID=3848 RepID=UPI00103BA995|nr:transcription factor IIIA-like [Glycine soja]
MKSSNMCEECGANFKKHTYLLQHVQSHSLEIRPYVCSAGNCQACYRRKDHLTCHLLQNQGKVFKCPVESCNTEFSLQSNMKGRVEETHEDSSTSTSDKSYKQHACPETGCGKVFRIALQL